MVRYALGGSLAVRRGFTEAPGAIERLQVVFLSGKPASLDAVAARQLSIALGEAAAAARLGRAYVSDAFGATLTDPDSVQVVVDAGRPLVRLVGSLQVEMDADGAQGFATALYLEAGSLLSLGVKSVLEADRS